MKGTKMGGAVMTVMVVMAISAIIVTAGVVSNIASRSTTVTGISTSIIDATGTLDSKDLTAITFLPSTTNTLTDYDFAVDITGSNDATTKYLIISIEKPSIAASHVDIQYYNANSGSAVWTVIADTDWTLTSGVLTLTTGISVPFDTSIDDVSFIINFAVGGSYTVNAWIDTTA